MMDWTGTADLITGGFGGNETDQMQDVGQRGHGPNFGEVNARHDRNPGGKDFEKSEPE